MSVVFLLAFPPLVLYMIARYDCNCLAIKQFCHALFTIRFFFVISQEMKDHPAMCTSVCVSLYMSVCFCFQLPLLYSLLSYFVVVSKEDHLVIRYFASYFASVPSAVS